MAGIENRGRRGAGVSSVVLALLAAACARPAPVVTEPLPVPETRVRVELPGPRTSLFGRRRQALVGTLVRHDSSTLDIRVRGDGPPLHIPISTLRAAYRSEGPRSRARAATIGGVRGGAAGVASGLIMAAFASSRDQPATRIIAGRAAGGAALGIALGLIAPGERWRRVRLPD